MIAMFYLEEYSNKKQHSNKLASHLRYYMYMELNPNRVLSFYTKTVTGKLRGVRHDTYAAQFSARGKGTQKPTNV